MCILAAHQIFLQGCHPCCYIAAMYMCRVGELWLGEMMRFKVNNRELLGASRVFQSFCLCLRTLIPQTAYPSCSPWRTLSLHRGLVNVIFLRRQRGPCSKTSLLTSLSGLQTKHLFEAAWGASSLERAPSPGRFMTEPSSALRTAGILTAASVFQVLISLTHNPSFSFFF